MIAAVAWPYNDLGDIDEVSILNPDFSQFFTILQAEASILTPNFSRFVEILQAEPFIPKEDFHVTIWTKVAPAWTLFQYLKVQLFKSMACTPPNSKIVRSFLKREICHLGLCSLPPGHINRGCWHWHVSKCVSVCPNTSVSGTRKNYETCRLYSSSSKLPV